jgi:Glycosyl transferase family group 2
MIFRNATTEANGPQKYYNIPPGDPLGQQTDLDVFFSTYEPLNDALGAARCMGTGFVVRHRALADIGGWPLIDVGEDFMLSSKLNDAGWHTAFVPENVQFGLAPESLRAHIKQKIRWVPLNFPLWARSSADVVGRSMVPPRSTNGLASTCRGQGSTSTVGNGLFSFCRP